MATAMAPGTSLIVALGLLTTGCVFGSATVGSDPSGSDSTAGGAPGGGGTGGSDPTAGGAPGGDGTGGSDPTTGGAPGGDGTGGGPIVTYSWRTGGFDACSLPCGRGTRIRAVTCIDSKGIPRSDGLCLDSKPDATETCNSQSCSNIACTAVINPDIFAKMTTISPATGPGPLTVTLNTGLGFIYFWDAIDFGDGTLFSKQDLVFQDLLGPGGDAFACVNHTFIAPGTYSVGHTQVNNTSGLFPLQEVIVVVQ
jgi:hypothetical protein